MIERENTQFLRRTLCLGIFQISLVLLLIGRLYVLQILDGAHYRLLAEGNRIAARPLIPSRGQLYDRNGVLLAQNKSSFRLVFLTNKKDQVSETLEILSDLIPFSDEEKEVALKTIQKKRGLDSIILKDELTWPEISALELHAADLPGISVEVGAVRTYPLHHQGAHLLGYVASPSEQEEAHDAVLSIPGMKTGKGGIEKYFETRLRGTPGYSAFEVNAKRKVVRELDQVAPVPGEDIHLTLDARLQDYAQDVLSSFESASAVVIDIRNGDILALVSHPSFDPNFFPQGISHKNWKELRDNPYVPMTNKGISGLYPPGSTIKPFVVLAALQAGVIDKNTVINCPGHICVGDHKFHCMHIHGPVNLSQAIARSCDVFFYEISKKVGIDRLATFFQEMGFGAGGLEDFPHRKKGLVPTKEWKKTQKQSRWTVSDTIQTSIGQGYMLATPLELAVAVARLVRGEKLTPRLEGKGEVLFQEMPYDKEHLKAILDSMIQTTNNPQGTAFARRITVEGMEMAGKTGTSQVRRITMAQRQSGQTKTHHLAWKYREHGLFIGFAPIHAPRYAIAVVVEHSGGSRIAVQAARDILLKAQILEKEDRS